MSNFVVAIMMCQSVLLGSGPASDSYLSIPKIIAAAKLTNAQAVHPGYGFLSQNSAFVDACTEAGLIFIGPTAEHQRKFGLKHSARALAVQAGVPLLPGTGLLQNVDGACQEAARIGYPVMLKSTGGGGGIGMVSCADETELREGFAAVSRLASSAFSSSGVFLEKFVERARHIEVSI